MTITQITGTYSHAQYGYILTGLSDAYKIYRWDEKEAAWILLNQYAWDKDNWTVFRPE